MTVTVYDTSVECNPYGVPTYDLATEDGIFLWKKGNVWHLRAMADSVDREIPFSNGPGKASDLSAPACQRFRSVERPATKGREGEAKGKKAVWSRGPSDFQNGQGKKGKNAMKRETFHLPSYQLGQKYRLWLQLELHRVEARTWVPKPVSCSGEMLPSADAWFSS